MTKDEIYEFIATIKSSVIGFNLDPNRCAGSWYKVLGKFSKREAWEAVEHIISNSERPPTVSLIKDRIGAIRYRQRQQEMNAEGDRHMRDAVESFKSVPGDTRYDKVLFVTAQRSAEHWLGGETDNDFYNSCLLNGQKAGITFDGVDYSKVTVSADYEKNWMNNYPRV